MKKKEKKKREINFNKTASKKFPRALKNHADMFYDRKQA